MFSALRAASSRSTIRSFSTSASRNQDLAKLTLVGRLTRDPEVRRTKSDAEYVVYSVATTNYPPPPPDANGERRPAGTTFHRVLSFSENAVRYLQNLKKGSRVYVEAGFELREPETGADPSTPQGQRQIFLKHEMIRVLDRPKPTPTEQGEFSD